MIFFCAFVAGDRIARTADLDALAVYVIPAMRANRFTHKIIPPAVVSALKRKSARHGQRPADIPDFCKAMTPK
jgi:hypothetical protein